MSNTLYKDPSAQNEVVKQLLNFLTSFRERGNSLDVSQSATAPSSNVTIVGTPNVAVTNTPSVTIANPTSITGTDSRTNTDLYNQINNSVVTMQAEYVNNNDFTVTRDSNTCLLITGAPFTVNNTNCTIMSIQVLNSAKVWVNKYVNFESGISLTVGDRDGVDTDNYITIKGHTGTPFAATDIAYRVTISGPRKTIDNTYDSVKVIVQNNVGTPYIDSVPVTIASNQAANTYPYPSATGVIMDGYKNITFQGLSSALATFTFWANLDGTTWVDITKAGYELITNTTGNTGFVNTSFLIDFSGLNVYAVKAQLITGSGTNSATLTYKLNN